MPPAFLAVLSHPGSQVTLSEFQDWYDNEHVPLRLDHLPSFLTGARYSSIDSRSPSWLALYDITDLSALQDESYTRLRTNRSPREADLVRRLEVLDRRTCEQVWDSGASTKTTGLGVRNPTRVVVTHELEGNDAEDAIKWAEERVQRLRMDEDWVRTRVFRCVDSLKTGVAVPAGPEAQVVPPFLVLHEFLSQGPTLQLKEMGIDDELLQVRKWELYRAYPSLSQSA